MTTTAIFYTVYDWNTEIVKGMFLSVMEYPKDHDIQKKKKKEKRSRPENKTLDSHMTAVDLNRISTIFFYPHRTHPTFSL